MSVLLSIGGQAGVPRTASPGKVRSLPISAAPHHIDLGCATGLDSRRTFAECVATGYVVGSDVKAAPAGGLG
jgi:hypothetical protein